MSAPGDNEEQRGYISFPKYGQARNPAGSGRNPFNRRRVGSVHAHLSDPDSCNCGECRGLHSIPEDAPYPSPENQTSSCRSSTTPPPSGPISNPRVRSPSPATQPIIRRRRSPSRQTSDPPPSPSPPPSAPLQPIPPLPDPTLSRNVTVRRRRPRSPEILPMHPLIPVAAGDMREPRLRNRPTWSKAAYGKKKLALWNSHEEKQDQMIAGYEVGLLESYDSGTRRSEAREREEREREMRESEETEVEDDEDG